KAAAEAVVAVAVDEAVEHVFALAVAGHDAQHFGAGVAGRRRARQLRRAEQAEIGAGLAVDFDRSVLVPARAVTLHGDDGAARGGPARRRGKKAIVAVAPGHARAGRFGFAVLHAHVDRAGVARRREHLNALRVDGRHVGLRHLDVAEPDACVAFEA